MTDKETLSSCTVEKEKIQHSASVTVHTQDLYVETTVTSTTENTKDLSSTAMKMFRETLRVLPANKKIKGYN